MKKHHLNSIIGYSLLYGFMFFMLFGLITVLIPNNYFIRMTNITILDYILLILTSLLLGIYSSLFRFEKKQGVVCDTAAVSGGIAGFLSFGCVVCNKLIILLFGVAGALTYIEPYRPIIGFAGITLMGYAVVSKGKNVLKKTKTSKNI